MKPAQGRNGMNPPSLFGMSIGAPFFHAGNARTLEDVFDEAVFKAHYQALAPSGFLEQSLTRSDQVARLVAFLLSIDETTEIVPLPDKRYDFCAP
jgi:hypothetical protein